MNTNELLEKLGLSEAKKEKLHVMRCFSAFVVVAGEKVIKVTDPGLSYCPLADDFYDGFKQAAGSPDAVKDAVSRIIEEKIQRFGFFTPQRKIRGKEIAIPYGASEMLMFALMRGGVDAVVVVCDGAGTVITNAPEIAQGIGARMHGLFFTSPIAGIIEKLSKAGARVPFPDARIDQVGGVEEAARLGYRRIAVTVSGFMGENLERVGHLEKKYGVRVTVLTVCTTGMTPLQIEQTSGRTDLIWGCASKEVRQDLGPRAILQLSRRIPVFVLTPKGLDFVSAYFGEEEVIRRLDVRKQYLVDAESGGRRLRVGDFHAFLREAALPVRSLKEPR